MRRGIRFVLNGERRSIASLDPTLTVLRYLRETERLTGSKEGCAEGDCGACTAVVAELDGEELRYSPVNTCIQFVAMLDGKALLTIESLRRPDRLHPVQQAIVDQHGSQCGFCTPGFVMSLYAGYRGKVPPERDRIDALLAGNLCRCTGYATIAKAAEQALGRPADDPDEEACDRALKAQLRALADDESFCVGDAGRSFIAPSSTGELAKILDDHPDATLLAGGTDVGLFVTKQHRVLSTVVFVGRIPELSAIAREQAGLRLGAAVTYRRAREALTALYPGLDPLIGRIGGTQVRAFGTVGGNIANGSPIGDMPPALIAVGSTLRLRRRDAIRDVPLEDYFLGYGRQDRRPGEFIESVFVPAPPPDTVFKAYKVSKRRDQDISSVCGAFRMQLRRHAGETRIVSARICFGGMAGTPLRARNTEACLAGRPWTASTVAEATAMLKREYQPISDCRASARYRAEVAGNLLRRCYLETTARARTGPSEVAHAS